MSDYYLESSWCRDELAWFGEDVLSRRAANTVFLVRVQATGDDRWPALLKDERGFALVGYDFVRKTEDGAADLPKGWPVPEASTDIKDYYEALAKLGSDMVRQIKLLAQLSSVRTPPADSGLSRQPREHPVQALGNSEAVYLASVPEDVEDVRERIAELLRDQGLIFTPEINLVDAGEIREHAGKHIPECGRFVQVLGELIGRWKHDALGHVMYQHTLAERAGKRIFVYRVPMLEVDQIRSEDYRRFIARFADAGKGSVDEFAATVARAATPGGTTGPERPPSLFVMAGAHDDLLEQEFRDIMRELNVLVLPLARSAASRRDVASVLDEPGSFLDVIKRCGGIVLLNGNVKEIDRYWIDRQIADIVYGIEPKLGRGRIPRAAIDAPPDPRLTESEHVTVFFKDSPGLRDDLEGWIRSIHQQPPASSSTPWSGNGPMADFATSDATS
jgi:hypothetical protein